MACGVVLNKQVNTLTAGEHSSGVNRTPLERFVNVRAGVTCAREHVTGLLSALTERVASSIINGNYYH